ncbi:NAD-dependent epimerase/dehydratase family protein [Solitalea lacus]|uniref:NAD-dependent epimerase/dehydratase family protein n=1 Tax=Solitalea lacus TaxID=2911172 RepID=UPI001EDAE4E3|nr:NAD-dependent epimerase/dehydratase family protein [Solitalea lacus]UKJ09043.1 NAD-dependent epimerase/dehydratase family protein [Solitalea lacus]
MALQTILGAGGAVGIELAKELSNYTKEIRLVSRNPKKINESDQLYSADLSDKNQVDKAVEGSEVVYLVIGFEYNTKVWQKKWPELAHSVITACKKHNAKLVFFDNMYMYDRDFLFDMTEETPIRPTSKKGKVRAQIANMILSEVETGNLTALIARSADFIGTHNSVLVELVYKNLKKGKAANWFITTDKIHSFTFVPDAAKATAVLGNNSAAFNQVWHLPTSSSNLTGRQWIELFARELNVKPKTMVLPTWLISFMGLFMPIMKEFKEMLYQYDRDYVFNSSKFKQQFGIEPTTPQQAVKTIIQESI